MRGSDRVSHRSTTQRPACVLRRSSAGRPASVFGVFRVRRASGAGGADGGFALRDARHAYLPQQHHEREDEKEPDEHHRPGAGGDDAGHQVGARAIVRLEGVMQLVDLLPLHHREQRPYRLHQRVPGPGDPEDLTRAPVIAPDPHRQRRGEAVPHEVAREHARFSVRRSFVCAQMSNSFQVSPLSRPRRLSTRGSTGERLGVSKARGGSGIDSTAVIHCNRISRSSRSGFLRHSRTCRSGVPEQLRAA